MKNWNAFWRYGHSSPVKTGGVAWLKIMFVAGLFSLHPARLAKACGPYDYSFKGYSFINPAVISEENPYATYFLSFQELSDQVNRAKEKQTLNNLTEWRGRFCDLVELEDLRQVIYESNLEDLELLRTSVRSNKLPLDYRMVNNTFAQHLKEEQCVETVDYLVFAKTCEPHVTAPDDAWVTPKRDSAAMMELARRGRKEFLKTKSYYIRLRYAYQIVRLAHYAKDYEAALELYDFLMPKIDKLDSIINYWILGHKAGALRGLGRNVEASYLYALIFQHSPAKRESAYRSFYIRNDEEWHAVNLLCQSDEERAILHAIRANSEDSKAIEEMQKIYELDPTNDNLDLLLVKEMRKLERDLLGLEFNDKKRQNRRLYNIPRPQAGQYLLNLQGFVNKLLSEDLVENKTLWALADGYLYFLAGNYYEAQKQFTTLSKKVSDKMLKEQLEAFKLALKIAAYDRIDEAAEEEIGGFVRYNEVYKKYPDFQDYLFDKLTSSYLENGQVGKAFLAQHKLKTLRYNPKVNIIDDLVALDKKKNKSIIERAFFRDEDGTKILNNLLELKATLLMSRNQLEPAIEIFRKLPEGQLERQQFNPFEERINDCVHCPPIDSVYLNKLEIAERIVALDYRGKVEMQEGARYFYQIGLAYYNMSYFGNSWQAMDYFRSGANWYYVNEADDYPLQKSPFGNKENNDLTLALFYFEKTRLMAKEPNLAAKACFMAAKCQQKMYLLSKESNYSIYSNEIPQLPEAYLSYFKLLKENYKDTEVVEQLIEECRYFEVYMTK